MTALCREHVEKKMVRWSLCFTLSIFTDFHRFSYGEVLGKHDFYWETIFDTFQPILKMCPFLTYFSPVCSKVVLSGRIGRIKIRTNHMVHLT